MVAILIFNSTSFIFLSSCPYFAFNSMNYFRKVIGKIANELAINFVLSINFNMYDILFVISSLFLSILVTSVYVNVPLLSLEQVIFSLNYPSNSFMVIQ